MGLQTAINKVGHDSSREIANVIAVISGGSTQRTASILDVSTRVQRFAAQCNVALNAVEWIRDGLLAASVPATRLRLARQQLALRRIAVSAGEHQARPLGSTFASPFAGTVVRRKRTNPLPMFRREIEVTYKHVLAWQLAAQRDDEWLLVLEDDATLSSGWESRLQRICEGITAQPSLQGVVMGGVCAWQDTLGSRLPARSSTDGRQVPYLVGNGAVAYLWHTELVRRVLRSTAEEPDWPLIPADWLVAAVSQKLGKLPLGGWMLVPNEMPFEHGTFSSQIRSSSATGR